MIICPGRAVETTVARMVAAQSFQRAGAASNCIEVVEHVGAGANLGNTVNFVRVEEGGRGSAADDSDLDTGGAEIIEDAANKVGELAPWRRSPGIFVQAL